jgi:hypothetical protein
MHTRPVTLHTIHSPNSHTTMHFVPLISTLHACSLEIIAIV